MLTVATMTGQISKDQGLRVKGEGRMEPKFKTVTQI